MPHDTSLTQVIADNPSGYFVSEAAINKGYSHCWPEDPARGLPLTEQSFRVVASDRPDLFPSGSSWLVLDLGGVRIFVGRPLV